MGRRKSKRQAPARRNMLVLDQIFDCPFCNHEKSCDVNMDKERNTGRVQCTKCFEDFQAKINFLSFCLNKILALRYLINNLVKIPIDFFKA